MEISVLSAERYTLAAAKKQPGQNGPGCQDLFLKQAELL